MKNILYVGNRADIKYFFSQTSCNALSIDPKGYNEIIIRQHSFFESDYKFDQFLRKVQKDLSDGITGIIIDLNWFDNDDYFGLKFAIHIRLSPFIGNMSKKGIILVDEKSPDVLTNNQFDPAISLFNAKGARFIKVNELFQINETNDPLFNPVFHFNFESQIANNEEEFHLDEFLKKIKIDIIPNPHDRHAISNEWGAHRLFLNCGHNIEEQSFSYPPSIQFKYLSIKHNSNFLSEETRIKLIQKVLDEMKSTTALNSIIKGSKLDFSNHPYLKNKNILLIDDNADKGWEVILKNIFGGSPFVVKTDFEQVNQFGNLLDINKYDLVFLDLRLPKILLKDVQLEHGIDLLDKLKFAYPHIPLIVFTASNKSWTLDEVSEKGADGMYVKESPEYAGDEKYSKENFESFVNTVLKCLDSYLILRPYWEKIVEIKENFLPEINDNDLDKKFKSRIEERLEMFFGLLKRGMGQRKYDQERFYFSDYELAFMTLWSTLNEISESFFEKKRKVFPIFDIDDGTKHDSHINRSGNVSVLDHFFTWTFKGTGSKYIDFYVKKDKVGKIEEVNGFMKFYPCSDFKIVTDEKRNQIPPFFKTDSMSIIEKIGFYTEKISMQIAFIVEVMNPTNKIEFFRKIFELNRKRNSLYLTHGSDISSGFFSQKEKDKRNQADYQINPMADIKDLFELVAFLLTGKEIKVNF